MKKSILRIVCGGLLSVLVLCSLTACGNKHPEYSSYIADGGIGDLNYWNGTYFDRITKKEVSLSVLGKEYAGKYVHSICNVYHSYVTDIYEDSDGIEFGIVDKSGQLAFINYMNGAFFDTEPYKDEVVSCKEEAAAIARDTAKKILQNLEDGYEQIYENPITVDKQKDGIVYPLTIYSIKFIRYADGYKTSDFITVEVTSKGNIALIHVGDINALNKFDIKVDKAKVEESIEKVLTEWYEATNYYILEEHTVNDQRLALTPEGELCLYSDLSVKLTAPGENQFSTGVSVLTIIQNP